MADVHLPADLDKLPVVAVLKGSPAHDWFMRMCDGRVVPGQIVPASEEELESLRKDVIAIVQSAS
jgi:hypothetical protein